MQENFNRVIPRDFFNEAKLLKCMGVLALAILDEKLPAGIKIEIEEDGEPFDIWLNDEFNFLFVRNYPVIINGEYYFVGSAYNNKNDYPFYVVAAEEIVLIFNVDGSFSEDFINTFTKK